MYKESIILAIARATGLDPKDIHLEVPENSQFGDFSTNVAMRLIENSKQIQPKDHKKASKAKNDDRFSNNSDPRVKAQTIANLLAKDKDLSKIVRKIEVAGPGFINFWLAFDILVDNLIEIDKQKETYGVLDFGIGKTVIVEYSSPNIAKPFTVGHLRSTIIGDALANLFAACGFKVLRDNHLGDWGTQFGKQIYAIKTWGDEKVIEKADRPVKELVALYVRFHKEAEEDKTLEDEGRVWFKKLEEGDPEARRLWQKCVDWSWKEFAKIYKELGVVFSQEFNQGRGLGEAFFEDKMQPVLTLLAKKRLLKKGKEGAQLIFFKSSKYPPAMLLKKDGATLYHTRDLATDKYRKDNYDPDLIVNEVGSEQTLYFQQLFEMEKMLGWFNEGQRVHVGHGLIRFKDRKMSTRKGDVVWLEEVLEGAIKRARKLGSQTKQLASSVGIGALKYNDLKRDPKTEIMFDWDEVLNMEGNSGPYLQYTYARTQSVRRKSGKSKLLNHFGKVELTSQESDLLRLFCQYSGVLADAVKNYSPNLVCKYLYTLAQTYNTLYNKEKILGSPKEDVLLALNSATGQILKNGLRLLGIDSPEKM